jgi:hypothetical protein
MSCQNWILFFILFKSSELKGTNWNVCLSGCLQALHCQGLGWDIRLISASHYPSFVFGFLSTIRGYSPSFQVIIGLKSNRIVNKLLVYHGFIVTSYLGTYWARSVGLKLPCLVPTNDLICQDKIPREYRDIYVHCSLAPWKGWYL